MQIITQILTYTGFTIHCILISLTSCMDIPNSMRILYKLSHSLSWSLWIADALSRCASIFFSSMWRMHKKSWFVTPNPTLMITNNFFHVLKEKYWIKYRIKLIAMASRDNYCGQFYGSGKIKDSFHWSDNSSLFQIELMRLWISDRDRLCGLVVRVLGYRSGGPGSIPGTTRKNM
jgi:hypothetical protein